MTDLELLRETLDIIPHILFYIVVISGIFTLVSITYFIVMDILLDIENYKRERERNRFKDKSRGRYD